MNDTATKAADQIIQTGGQLGAVLVLVSLALCALMYHILRTSKTERERFHSEIQTERERTINTIETVNEFTRRQSQLVDAVVQENRDTRAAFENSLTQILHALQGKI
tara:strand:+ start:3401 stop:3721 length:321 start_codon:yes stop_codon:yes gene_type:complete